MRDVCRRQSLLNTYKCGRVENVLFVWLLLFFSSATHLVAIRSQDALPCRRNHIWCHCTDEYIKKKLSKRKGVTFLFGCYRNDSAVCMQLLFIVKKYKQRCAGGWVVGVKAGVHLYRRHSIDFLLSSSLVFYLIYSMIIRY